MEVIMTDTILKLWLHWRRKCGRWWNYCKYLSLWVYPMFSMRAYSLFRFVL